MTVSPLCRSRSRTSTDRWPSSSPRSTRSGSVRTATGRCSRRAPSTPSSSPSCNTSWRRWSGVSPAWRIRCWRSWSAARSCRVSRQASWPRSTSCRTSWPRPSRRATRRAREIDQLRHQSVSRRDELVSELDADLVALYERQRARGGAGAGLLQGRRCGACRIEIDRGELARISAAADDEVLRCPECGAILLRVKGTGA